MINFIENGYSPVYIRSNGDDTTADGSLEAPFLTAQAAYNFAYNNVSIEPASNYVLDFGIGNFGTIVLAGEWLENIAVSGAGPTQTFLDGINGNGDEPVYGESFSGCSNAKNMTLLSDGSINLGNISLVGGSAYCNETSECSGGSLSCTDCIIQSINCGTGGGCPPGSYNYFRSANGGTVTLIGDTKVLTTINGASSINTSSLKKGYSIQKSNILGL